MQCMCKWYVKSIFKLTNTLNVTHLTIGKQPCLWCLVTIDDLEGNCSLRGPFPARTVESMCDDYKRFIASGGDIKKVKYFNNCKGEPLFPIPLNQVNNQNFMFSHLICACANKGLPSSIAHINGHLLQTLLAT